MHGKRLLYRMSNPIDISGQKFNMLTAIRPFSIKFKNKRGRCKSHSFFECLCDCGKVCNCRSYPLREGKILSCGCSRRSRTNTDRELFLTRAVYRSNILERSKRRFGHSNALTFEEFYFKSRLPCIYCGRIKQSFLKDLHTDYVLWYNGMDRLNNNEPYSLENCAPACGVCNSLKWTETFDAFISRMRATYVNLDLANYNSKDWEKFKNQQIPNYPVTEGISAISIRGDMSQEFLWRGAYSANIITPNKNEYGIGTDISFDEYISMASSNCFYCDSPELTSKMVRKNKLNILNLNTIDRVNSKIPYILSNVVPACKICNLGKRERDIDVVLETIKLIVEKLDFRPPLSVNGIDTAVTGYSYGALIDSGE